MKLFSMRFLPVWQRDRDVFFRLWRTEAPGTFAEPIFIIVAMGLGLGVYVGQVDSQRYIEFIAPGIIGSYAMFSSTFECTYGSFVRMEYQKTFDAIIVTPVNVEDVIAGEILWGTTRALLSGVVILAIVAAFGLVHSPWALLVPVVSCLEGLLFASLAMLFTSVVPAIYSFNYFFTLFITPMFFFSGVFFPLSSFPPLVQALSWIAPLTSVVKILRALVSGQFHAELLPALAIIVILIVILFPLAIIRMRKRLIV